MVKIIQFGEFYTSVVSLNIILKIVDFNNFTLEPLENVLKCLNSHNENYFNYEEIYDKFMH